jgi:hypothetical protein
MHDSTWMTDGPRSWPRMRTRLLMAASVLTVLWLLATACTRGDPHARGDSTCVRRRYRRAGQGNLARDLPGRWAAHQCPRPCWQRRLHRDRPHDAGPAPRHDRHAGQRQRSSAGGSGHHVRHRRHRMWRPRQRPGITAGHPVLRRQLPASRPVPPPWRPLRLACRVHQGLPAGPDDAERAAAGTIW